MTKYCMTVQITQLCIKMKFLKRTTAQSLIGFYTAVNGPLRPESAGMNLILIGLFFNRNPGMIPGGQQERGSKDIVF